MRAAAGASLFPPCACMCPLASLTRPPSLPTLSYTSFSLIANVPDLSDPAKLEVGVTLPQLESNRQLGPTGAGGGLWPLCAAPPRSRGRPAPALAQALLCDVKALEKTVCPLHAGDYWCARRSAHGLVPHGPARAPCHVALHWAVGRSAFACTARPPAKVLDAGPLPHSPNAAPQGGGELPAPALVGLGIACSGVAASSKRQPELAQQLSRKDGIPSARWATAAL